MLPAIQRIFESDIFGRTRGPKSTKGVSENSHNQHFSSAVPALGSGDSKTRNFHRLYDDAIPLDRFDKRSEIADVERTITQDTVAQDTIELVPHNSIQVRKA